MQSLAEVKQFAAELLGEEVDDTTLSTTLLPRWVSRGLEKIYRKTYWRWNEDQISLTWSSSGVLYLPHFIYRLISLRPAGVSRPSVDLVTAADRDYRWRRTYRPQLVSFGYYGVEADNPSEGVLTVAVSNVGTGSQSVRIHGLNPSNYEVTETIAVPINTSSPTVNSFKSGVGGVKNIELFGTATGAIVTVSRGGTTLERLDSSRERRHEHLRSELGETGGANVSSTYDVRYWRRPLPPSNENELIPIPFEFHSLLETWIEYEILRWREQFEAAYLLKKDFEMDLVEAIRFDRRDPAIRQRVRVAWGRTAWQ